MRAAFAEYLDHNKGVEAVFVGTRRTDPHGGKLDGFQRTDHGWPGFMRVHPVIEWRYGEVWAVSCFFFLISFSPHPPPPPSFWSGLRGEGGTLGMYGIGGGADLVGSF